jgi:hypothetical protein
MLPTSDGHEGLVLTTPALADFFAIPGPLFFDFNGRYAIIIVGPRQKILKYK